jgi:hypothetical protein
VDGVLEGTVPAFRIQRPAVKVPESGTLLSHLRDSAARLAGVCVIVAEFPAEACHTRTVTRLTLASIELESHHFPISRLGIMIGATRCQLEEPQSHH